MRTAGILLPVSALPSPGGIGTLGRAAYEFVDFLAAAGQGLWQVLPVGPTGYGDSPYQSFSAFAGNPYFIDPGLLEKDGLLTADEVREDELLCAGDGKSVNYGALYGHRFALLRAAYARFSAWFPDEWYAWCYENGWWADDYAAYMTAKEQQGQKPLAEWPEALRRRDAGEMKRLWETARGEIDFWRFTQYFFTRQWKALHAYAHTKNVRILGDMPIYVSADSADVWASPRLFELTEDGAPKRVAGCPPDYFSPDGQLWGNPLYDWPVHRAEGFAWWKKRVRHALSVYDVLRIDHFRGFAGYYAVPAGEKTARRGEWCPGPGRALFDALAENGEKLPIVAEDLGFVTPDVRELLAATGFPGMKVLQFAFSPDNDYLPHNHVQNGVVYPGTHDNDTARGWYEKAPEEEKAFMRAYLMLPEDLSEVDAGPAIVCASLASVADTCVVPMADWLGLGSEGRVNTPGRPDGNWQWRLPAGAADAALAEHIREICARYGRCALQKEEENTGQKT